MPGCSCTAATTSPISPSTRPTRRPPTSCCTVTCRTRPRWRRSRASWRSASCPTRLPMPSTVRRRLPIRLDMVRARLRRCPRPRRTGRRTDRDASLAAAIRLIALLPTAIGRHHRRRQGLEPVAPDASLSYSENFLTMLSGKRPTEREARIFDIAMILHAEHEMNASTFTARVVAGTGADLTAAVVAAIAALSGPLHGGANAAAMALFEQWGSAERTPAAVHEMLERKEKLFGFGHPLYWRLRPARGKISLKRLSRGAGAGRRAELVRDHGGRRADGLRGEGPVPERRPLLGLGLPLSRDPDRPVHDGLRREPDRRPVGARARAAERQQDHPPSATLSANRAAPTRGGRELARGCGCSG